MAKINIANGIISSSADYGLYRGTSKIVNIQDGEFRVLGDLIAENYIVSSSVSNIEYQSLSGSTIFGDSADDTHVLSGSVTIKSPSGDALILDDNNNGANKLSWAYNGTSQYYMRRLHTDGEFYISSNGSGGAVNITGDSNHGNMPVHIGYRLGIGNTGPNSPLDVRRGSDGIALELISTVGDADEFVDLKMISGNTTAGTLGTILRHQRQGTGGGDLIILTNGTLSGTPTETIRFTSDQKVGIGTDSPDGTLHSHTATAGSVVAHASANEIVAENDNDGGISILTPNNKIGGIFFGDPDDNNVGMIQYSHALNRFAFTAAASSAPGFTLTGNTAEFGASILRISGSATSTGSFGALTIGGSALNANLISGRVGIGTTSPGAKLDIRAATGEDALHCYDRNGAIMFEIDQFGQILSYNGIANTNSSGTAWTFSTGATTVLKLDQNSRISLSNNDSGTSNTVFGKLAGASIDAGSNYNTFIGENVADASLDDAIYNSAVGYSTLSALTSGDYNTAIGSRALLQVNSGAQNTALGYYSGYGITTGNNNVHIGTLAGEGNTGASYLVGIGDDTFRVGAVTSDANGTVAVGYKALRYLKSGQYNTAIGFEAGLVLTDLDKNTLIGYQAGKALSGSAGGGTHTFVGYKAGAANTIGNSNTFVGSEAGTSITNGLQNTAMGRGALATADGGETNNVAIGMFAMNSVNNDSSDDNICLGTNAGKGGTGTFSRNVAIGTVALENSAGNVTYNNVAIGYNSANDLSGGHSNVMVGYGTGDVATTASGSVFLGFDAGGTLTTGNDNIAIGNDAMNGGVTTGDNNIAIGASAGDALTSGYSNTFLGNDSGGTITTGHSNTFIGKNAATNNNSGTQKTTAIGASAGANGDSDESIFIGFAAAGSGTKTNATDGTVAIGKSSLGSLTSGAGNIAIGLQSLDALTEAADNLAIGFGALTTSSNVNAARNIAIGNYALELLNSDGRDNIAIGYEALETANHADIDANIAIGSYVLDGVGTNGVWACVGIGAEALSDVNHADAAGSVAIGYFASRELTSGQQSTVVGYQAGRFATTADNSTFIGYQAGQGITSAKLTGNDNTAIGHDAGLLLQSSAHSNTLVGSTAGDAITSGFDNTCIGFGTSIVDGGAQNRTAIGAGAVSGANNRVVIGNTSVTEIYLSQDAGAKIHAGEAAFGGNVIVAGTISGSLINSSGDVVAFNTSDERLKDNIKLIKEPIEKIKQLRGVEYQWNEKQNTYPTGSLDSGIIAQDVQKVLPQLVKQRGDGYLGVRQERLVGLLIESIKDQQDQIDDLRKQIKEMKDGSS